MAILDGMGASGAPRQRLLGPETGTRGCKQRVEQHQERTSLTRNMNNSQKTPFLAGSHNLFMFSLVNSQNAIMDALAR